MPAADYRILTDATGQRIAAAIEALDGGEDGAKKTDLTSIIATGTTNQTGAAITAGTYFYLNGALVQAKADIASGATFTEGTNYEAVTAGGLNALNSLIGKFANYTVISQGSDLNNFTESGVYSCATMAVAHTLINSPVNDSGFVLLALKWETGTTQLIIASAGRLLFRRLITESWVKLTAGSV